MEMRIGEELHFLPIHAVFLIL